MFLATVIVMLISVLNEVIELMVIFIVDIIGNIDLRQME